MTGITFAELYYFIKTNREIEFSYQGFTYGIENGESEGRLNLYIWKFAKNADTGVYL